MLGQLIRGPADWVWVAPMLVLSALTWSALLDGILFSASTTLRRTSNAVDLRLLILGEVQRCCVVVGFLGTLCGAYRVLLSLGAEHGAAALQSMFTGMATALLSSVVGCIIFLLSAAAENVVVWRHKLCGCIQPAGTQEHE